MAGKKTNKRAGKRTARKTALKKGNKTLYKAVKAIAKNEAEKIIETKYATSLLKTDTVVPSVTNELTSLFLISPVGLSTLIPVLPPIARGTGSDQILGSRIQMMSGRTEFLFSIKQEEFQSLNLIVKLFCLESRKVKDYNEMSTLPPGRLLRTGADNVQDWTPSTALGGYNPLNDLINVNKASFKVHHVKHFRFTKNCGRMNGDLSTPPPAPNSAEQAQHRFTWHWGSNMKLKYDDEPLASGAGQFPTNFAPIWGVVAYYPDGTSVGVDGADMPIHVSAVNHLYYKDG